MNILAGLELVKYSPQFIVITHYEIMAPGTSSTSKFPKIVFQV
jgi:hypothetical protein